MSISEFTRILKGKVRKKSPCFWNANDKKILTQEVAKFVLKKLFF